MRRWFLALALVACHAPRPRVVPDAFLTGGPSIEVKLDERGAEPRKVMRYSWLATPRQITVTHTPPSGPAATEHGAMTATDPNRVDITLGTTRLGYLASGYAMVADGDSPLAAMLPRSWPDSAIGAGARWREAGSPITWDLVKFEGPRAMLHGKDETTDVTLSIDVTTMHIDATIVDAGGQRVVTIR